VRALIPRAAYRDPAVFEAEQAALFRGHWQLAAFAVDLQRDQDFVCTEVAGQSVVIQRFGDELRAFHNVCSHRASRIQCAEKGNRPLRCPYHGWAYDQSGAAFSIPHRSQFDPADLEPAKVALTRWQLEVLHGLVFVRASASGPSLVESLEGAAPAITAIGDALGERLGTHRLTMRANWKVVVENTLEAYHVASIHQDTLVKLGLNGLDFTYFGPHSRWSSKPTDPTNKMKEALYRAFRSRPLQSDEYVHHLLFPNVTIAVSYGMSFNVNVIRPVAPDVTEVNIHVFETRLGELEPRERALVRAMRPAIVDLTTQIFREDQVVCEAVQQGLAEGTRDLILSREEERLARFQQAYLAQMQRAHPGAAS
jgi:phenylpropionate dioxygenase-like ring-hydroxylating dioxygenase large terminal subunit